MNERAEGQILDKVFVLKKKYIVIAVFALVLIFICVLLSISADATDEISLFYSSSQQGVAVVKGDTPAKEVMQGKSMSSVRYSQNKSHAAVLMSEGSSYTLYFTDGKKCIKIADKCTNNYVISYDGRKVVYMDSSDTLYIADSKDGKSTVIDTNAVSFCVSPSAKAVVYTKNTDSTGKLYVYTGSKTFEADGDYVPLAVSDGLEYIYVLSSDNSLYALDKDGTIRSKICSDVSPDMFCFSSDMSDVVFSDGTYTYISQSGKSRVRLIPHKAEPAVNAPVAPYCDSSSLSSVYDSLTEIFYFAVEEDESKTLFFIDKDCVRTDVAGNVKKYLFTGGNSIAYLDTSGKIYRYDKGKSVLAVSGATDILTDSKGKYIYYPDSSSQLYVFRKDSPVLLASGVKKMYITDDDVLLFVMTDDRLFSVKKDSQAQLVDENVYGCICNSSASFYIKNYSSQTGTFELFGSDGSLNFSLISENISGII